ncbi:helix-turn-helix domain-containing protein [Variovorax sp. dw_308]|uniref:helix-turn-helix domain-containing protein n=1 Tax=Variovorax sp. dw_308 TaxID=2721546 RepID=UPI001C46C40A|nr:helix-turn-helix domain-containing protein [Variovorax sp. dw_308]
MPKHPTKTDRLRELGALNPQPQRVHAAWFDSAGFFDANDLVQVKYEMLRHARQDGVTKAEAASLFGLSRPTFYLAEASFAREGISGLLPQPRRPKSAHKLTPEVMTVINEHHLGSSPIQARTLAQLVHKQLGISVHPRSIERAIARKKNAEASARHRSFKVAHERVPSLRDIARPSASGPGSARWTGRHRLPRHVARSGGAAQCTTAAFDLVDGDS